MYLMGVPVITIMAISGHKSEKSFLRYIKAEDLHHVEIVRKYWENNIQKNNYPNREAAH